MSTIDVARDHFESGLFNISIDILDKIIQKQQIATLLELKVHNLMELNKTGLDLIFWGIE